MKQRHCLDLLPTIRLNDRFNIYANIAHFVTIILLLSGCLGLVVGRWKEKRARTEKTVEVWQEGNMDRGRLVARNTWQEGWKVSGWYSVNGRLEGAGRVVCYVWKDWFGLQCSRTAKVFSKRSVLQRYSPNQSDSSN